MPEGKMMEKIQYKRINTESLWEIYRADTDNLSIAGDGLRLSSHPVYEFGEVVVEDNSLDMTDIAIDECDNLYIVDEKSNAILRSEKDSGLITEMGCRPGILPVECREPSGIAIDQDTLYIADNGNDRLVALARSNLQIRWILPVKGPSDICVGGGEHIYVIETGEKRVLTVSRGGKIEGSIGSGVLTHPTDIAVAGDGDLFVLDQKGVYVFRHDGITQEINVDFSPSGLSVDKEKNIFMGESGPDDPLKTIHQIEPGGKAVTLWSYRGASKRLINDSRGNLYVINSQGNRLTFLKYTRVNSLGKAGTFSGYYLSKPIDGQVAGRQWHRFLLEGAFNRGTQIDFLYYLSDERLPDGDIKNENHEWYKGVGEGASNQGEEIRDALFLEKSNAVERRGRYLYFKLLLSGSESLSPVVESLTLFFPRVSYLKYLPAFYQKDPVSKSFLERFLSLFESVLFDFDFTIDHLSRFFDAGGTPPEFLPWLASWLSISIDENWPEVKRRLFIQKAVELYKKRGTREGLEETLDLYLKDQQDSAGDGKKPYYVVENFLSDGSLEKGDLINPADMDAIFFPPQGVTLKIHGQETGILLLTALFGKERFSFCVFLRESVLKTGKIETIQKLIEEQKPAHTCFGLKVLEPWFYLDRHTYLGINTTLTKPVFVLGEKSVIGRDMVLDDREQSGQVGRHARVGMDIKLT
jgi:phage tail-like protein